ncbi:unnamed protein product [Moneuplotes crassus]|uniref:Uncharacterized protein n=1 Tax=Euplotes crassus TaxID=5936 RepID=A0AAD1XCS6_EUPCR|nr:unnamed protein product [Moneuplotes crassus]
MEKKLTKNKLLELKTIESKNNLRNEILQINNLAMEYCKGELYDKCIKNIDKANHLIELHFPKNFRSQRNSIVGYINQVFRYQLISVTYNNCACLYKKKSKLLLAFKCLQFALNADKDLLRLFENISEIRSRQKFEALDNEEQLDKLRLNDSYRNDMASTYLNMCAVLSLMKTHDKALGMAQKAIEIITNQRNVYCFDLETTVKKLEDKLKITLAAGYYNKAVELEYLNQQKKLKREYSLMSYSSIKNAIIVCNSIPKAKDLEIYQEIMKFNKKIHIVNQIRVSSRGSSRSTQKRIFSPPAFSIPKGETSQFQNFWASSPKSSDGTIKPMYYSRTNEEKAIPFFQNRKQSKGERVKGDQADIGLSFPSPKNSIDERESDSDNQPYNQRNMIHQMNYTTTRRQMPQILKYNFKNSYALPIKNSSKTSFEVQPIPAFKRSIVQIPTTNSIGNISNNSGGSKNCGSERLYIDESDFIQSKMMEIEKVHRSRKKKNRSTRPVVPRF